MSIVYKSELQRGLYWQQQFARELPDIAFHLWPETGDPTQVEYLIAWIPPEDCGERFPNLKVVFSVGAGVDQFDVRQLPPGVKVVRMVDPGITQGVVEYVTLATLALHRDLPAYLNQQRQAEWHALDWVPAGERRVGIMGLGNMGQAVIRQLQGLGFALRGWSRSRHALAGIDIFAGSEELPAFLADCDILVCMLPLTDDTRHILCADTFAHLPDGARLINAGRGGHLVEQDLLAALDSGRIHSAFLDVAEQEPLPPEHPFWQHPGVIFTPHIAGVTRAGSAYRQLIDNVRRHRAGDAMIGEVDTSLGY